MRKETHEQADCTYHLRFFDDWLDFLSLAERVEREGVRGEFGGMSCASLEMGERDWYGTNTLAEAIQLARKGWPEGVVQVNELMNRIDLRKLYPHSERIVRDLDVAGDEPDVGLYLAGEPEHMVTLWERKLPQRGKVVRILLSRAGLSYVCSSAMVRRGVAIMLAFEVMRLLGYSPELTVCFSSNKNGAQIEHYVPVLHAGDPINRDTLAFMFQHPAVLRRLCFAVKECEPVKLREQLEVHSGGGYARSCTPVFPPDHDLLIKWEDGLVSSDDEIVPYALEILKEVGIDIELDEQVA